MSRQDMLPRLLQQALADVCRAAPQTMSFKGIRWFVSGIGPLMSGCVYHRGQLTQWDTFMRQMQPLAAQMPWMVIEGVSISSLCITHHAHWRLLYRSLLGVYKVLLLG